MWNSGVGDVGAGYAPNVVRSESVSVAPVAEVDAVKQLVNNMFKTTSSTVQTAQSLSDSLKALQEKLGVGTFKNDLNKLIEILEAFIASLAAVRQTMQQVFPDAGDSTLPGPPRNSHQVRTFNRPQLRNRVPINNYAPTQGVSHSDPYTDSSDPGRKPGVGNEPGNIWSGFKQGPTKENCITVASIKAAMMRFGQKPTDIFKQVIAAGDGYDIQMRDNGWYHLSKGELAEATLRSQFSGDNPSMVANANFLYAVSAKRAQVENNDGYASEGFGRALHSINDGEDDRGNGLRRLGLGAHIRETTVANLTNGQLGVVTHGVPINGQMVGHSLAVINGREEVWGTQGGHPPTDRLVNALALV